MPQGPDGAEDEGGTQRADLMLHAGEGEISPARLLRETGRDHLEGQHRDVGREHHQRRGTHLTAREHDAGDEHPCRDGQQGDRVPAPVHPPPQEPADPGAQSRTTVDEGGDQQRRGDRAEVRAGQDPQQLAATQQGGEGVVPEPEAVLGQDVGQPGEPTEGVGQEEEGDQWPATDRADDAGGGVGTGVRGGAPAAGCGGGPV